MPSFVLTFLLHSLLLATVQSDSCITFEGDIGRFFKFRDFKFVTVFHQPHTKVESKLVSALMRPQDRFIRMASINHTVQTRGSDFHIYWTTGINADFAQILNQTADHRIQQTLILIPLTWNSELQLNLETHLRDLGRNSKFYLAHCGTLKSANLEIISVLTIKHQSQFVLNKLQTFEGEILPQQKEDLQGIQLQSIALTWSPYYTLSQCEADGSNCVSTGFLKDYCDIVAKMFNFTLVSFEEVNNDWGTRPVINPVTKELIYTGVMGGVINGDYDLSISQWAWTWDRDHLMDFVPIFTNSLQLSITPQPLSVDPGLFIRPLTPQAWRAAALITLILTVALVGPYFVLRNFENTNSYMVVSISGWYFFVLLNAFYGGALTMFFSSDITIPFQSIRDVIRAYPDYKLLMITGNDVIYQELAKSGDPDFQAFWQRAVSNEAETVVPDVKTGLDRLQNERAVLHIFNGMLRGFFKENPFHSQVVQTFGQESVPTYQCLVFPKNSPLRSIFNDAAIRLRERGTDQRLLLNWEGKPIRAVQESNPTPLGSGQVVLGYIIMGGGFLISLLALVVEFIIKPCFRITLAKCQGWCHDR